MTDEPPQKLDYRVQKTGGDSAPSRSSVIQLLVGLALGSAASGLIWVFGWEPFVKHGSGAALYLVPLAKVAVAVVFLCTRHLRPFGAGVLLSVSIGVLIFLGSCAANFKV